MKKDKDPEKKKKKRKKIEDGTEVKMKKTKETMEAGIGEAGGGISMIKVKKFKIKREKDPIKEKKVAKDLDNMEIGNCFALELIDEDGSKFLDLNMCTNCNICHIYTSQMQVSCKELV